jgi:carboxyl-terminal processing protease
VSKSRLKKLLVTFGFAASLLAAFGLGYAVSPYKPVEGLNVAELNQIYRLLKDKYDGDLTPKQALEGAKAGMAASTGDPYTAYLTEEALKQLNDDLAGTLSGIGAEVGIRNNRLTIIAPIADSPAAKAGLRAKDDIARIDGEDPSGMTLDQAVSKIRGPKGTTVTLTIIRGNGQPFDVTITRDVITVNSVKSEIKTPGIGYIQITRFGSDTGSAVAQAAAELKSQGADRFIIDLRNNPGGYLDASVKVAEQFISGKVVVEEKKNGKTFNTLSSGTGGELVGSRLVVLINGGSASASEIVAGALQDHGAAVIVGEKSFGKGSVQELAKLSEGAGLKVTVAHWFTPKGRNITKDGIKPDIEVKLEAADLDAGRDPQLDRALQELK